MIILNNKEKYDAVFCTVFGVNKDALGENFTFNETTEWDSVAHLGLISELEDTFDVMFETEDILHYGSYMNGLNILRKYGVEI